MFGLVHVQEGGDEGIGVPEACDTDMLLVSVCVRFCSSS